VPASKLKNTLKKFLPMYKMIEACNVDTETLVVEVFLRNHADTLDTKNISYNSIIKTLLPEKGKFLIYRQFTSIRPGKITFILDSEKDFARAISLLFKLRKFKPIMKL
jgi:hypothetical protein